MLQLATSTDQDEWLAALLSAFDAAAKRTAPISREMLAETERHLRANSRSKIAASRIFTERRVLRSPASIHAGL